MVMEAIVKAINKSGLTRYRIGKDTGIDQKVLHRIFHGGSCSVETVDILCKYLRLELRPKKKKAGKK